MKVQRALGAALFALLLTFALVFAPVLVPIRTTTQFFALRAVSVVIWLLVVRIVLAPMVQCTPADLGVAANGRTFLRFAKGVLAGGALLSVAFCIAWCAGGFDVVPGAAWEGASRLGADVALFLIAAWFEELCFRVGLLATLRRALPPALATGISAAVFGLLHAQNPGATNTSVLNTMLAGVLLGLLFLERRGEPGVPSLGLVTGFHFAWNVTASCFFGNPVSGFVGKARVFAVEPKDVTWSGGSYGLEGGLAATLVLAAACVWAARKADLRPLAPTAST